MSEWGPYRKKYIMQALVVMLLHIAGMDCKRKAFKLAQDIMDVFREDFDD